MAKAGVSRKKTELMIGGQAVIEGVMMRTKDRYAIAIRNGKRISLKKEKFVSLTHQNRFLGLPFIRGIIMLIETMILGVKSLNYAVNMAEGKDKQQVGASEIAITFIFSIIVALAIFKFLPLLFATLARNLTGENNLIFNLVDGISKIGILIGYLYLISLMPDVKRLFQYHGAEHKTVSCYEKNKKLTVENVKKESTAHPRCGTSFIVLVIMLSIIFYLLIPISTGFWEKLGIRILMLPLISGIAYELIRISGKHERNLISRIIIAPSMLVQRLTTREPDRKQMEVAIAALKGLL